MYRNAEGVPDQRNVGNPCDKTTVPFMGSGHNLTYVSPSYGHVYGY